jgi:predicted CopG family antitoxin
MGSRTRLPISPDVRDRLRRRKVGGDTYDDVIVRLLEETAESP